MTFEATPALFGDDFAALLEASFSEEAHERGDLVTGVVVAQDSQGLIVAIDGMKRDGIVQRRDLDRMGVGVERFPIGTEMDVKTDRFASTFVFNNPNQTAACGCGESVAITPAVPGAAGG